MISSGAVDARLSQHAGRQRCSSHNIRFMKENRDTEALGNINMEEWKRVKLNEN